jgi:DNA-directed RNA polymerase subunit RPC12/RpoP
MSLWKVKFNHKDGETRKCKVCDKDFHTMKPVWRCCNCTSKIIFDRAKEKHADGLGKTGKWAGMPPKKSYPFSNRTTEASNRFCTIRTALSNAWKQYNETGDKSSVIEHYNKQLEEIQTNGIMEWILDRRGKDDLPNGQQKLKSKKQTNIEFPDTRGHYEY